MKKLVFAVVVSFAASAVYAETSVTLYGGADGGITVQKLKGKSATVKFANGSLNTNMFGFTGTEDLGSETVLSLDWNKATSCQTEKKTTTTATRPLIVRLTWVLKATSGKSHSAESERLVPTTANTPFPVHRPTTPAFPLSATSIVRLFLRIGWITRLLTCPPALAVGSFMPLSLTA